MRAKINKSGYLSLEDKGHFSPRFCPYANRDKAYTLARCGDWCAAFTTTERAGDETNFASLGCFPHPATHQIVSDERIFSKDSES